MTGNTVLSELQSSFKGRRVLVTGHTGFKGGWLCLWLRKLGADVVGVSLPAPEGASFYKAVSLTDKVDDRTGDIRDGAAFAKVIADVDADLLIHMAAQAIVRESYETPVDTYMTNVIGTANVLEVAKKMPSLKAVLVVTSDKCYENSEWVWGYRECDPMGGSDPYSSSKGCAELVTSAYRRSFFSDDGGLQLASVRAGNVFGGGDWAADRLIPDIIRATSIGMPTHIRNPGSTRPWQHVLEPLTGYLQLSAAILTGDNDNKLAEGWNFGPDPDGVATVENLARSMQRAWGQSGPEFAFGEPIKGPHEANILRLDSTKARVHLGWRPRLSLDDAVDLTVRWYRAHTAGSEMGSYSEKQIEKYSELLGSASL